MNWLYSHLRLVHLTAIELDFRHIATAIVGTDVAEIAIAFGSTTGSGEFGENTIGWGFGNGSDGDGIGEITFVGDLKLTACHAGRITGTGCVLNIDDLCRVACTEVVTHPVAGGVGCIVIGAEITIEGGLTCA